MSKGIRVFKFGGASIKDPDAVRNMTGILKKEIRPEELLIIVVSAMGKTTNALETILYNRLDGHGCDEQLAQLQSFHFDIISGLHFRDHSGVIKSVSNILRDLRNELENAWADLNISEAQKYDMVVPFGEMLSSRIIYKYLIENQIDCEWLDARHFIKTSSDFREGIIDWSATRKQINSLAKRKGVYITQGFIGSDLHGKPTTLGREGSDFTAAIFGSSLNADSITIWKDVPGILNADPKLFGKTSLFSHLSYSQAAEMTYYGASVIHPKTIKPLANSYITLNVRSFLNPGNPGTIIGKKASEQKIPIFILKNNQALMSFKVKDFTFINEEQLGIIFHALDACLIKINVMQNSAISLTVAIDNRRDKINQLIGRLETNFDISITENLGLLTIIDYEEESLGSLLNSYDVLLEQRTLKTCQYIVSGVFENHFQ